MLNSHEIKKYSRHLLLNEIGEAGQIKLKQSKVLVIGAGGLGCPVLQYLAVAGVGTIGIVDFDTIDESNLQRQVLYTEEDIGKLKAKVACDRLQKQNSLITVLPYCEKLSAENVERLFTPYEIIVDCTDNFSSRYLINDACVVMNMSMVYGSIHRFQGQVSVFNFTGGNKKSPTYRCLFPEPPSKGTIPNCSEVGVLGMLPGIIGLMQATEVIKMIAGVGEVLSGKLLCFDALTMHSSIIEIERNPMVEIITPVSMKELRNMYYTFDCELNSVNEISVAELRELLLHQNQIQFLDVRNHDEVPIIEELKGLKIPLAEIENHIDKISRTDQVIVYCKSGKRSAAAIKILSSKFQFANLCNLKDGADAWLR